MRPFRRKSSGFTLIEILIALVVLMVGIVGILSLFPVGIKNVNDSVEDSTAANIALSLYNAMTEAMRRPNALGEIVLTHDGLEKVDPSPAPMQYKFALPAGVAVLHPLPGTGTDATLDVFQMGMAKAADDPLKDITTPPGWSAGGDPTEPSRQYSFQFEVSKPAGLDIPTDPPTPIPLYQFRFIIYRNYEKRVVAPGDVHPDQIKEYTTMIAGSGL